MTAPLPDKNLRRMLQFGQTRRYHTQTMLQSQDVAQHSYNVVMLLMYLCTEPVPAELMLRALLHDAGERWTGDMPADVKIALNMGQLMDHQEHLALDRAGVALPDISLEQQRLLKLSDALEGLLHCMRDVQLGNRLPDHREMIDNYLKYAGRAARVFSVEHVARQRALEIIDEQERLCDKFFS